MNRYVERIYPYVGAIAATGAILHWNISFPKGHEILSATITIGAILTGFLATTKSLVVSIDSENMKILRSTKFFGLLVSYLREAIYTSLLLSVVGMIGFFFDTNNPHQHMCAIWIFLVVSTLLTFLRVTNGLLSLIESEGNRK